MFTVVIPVLNQHDATRNFIQTWFDTARNRFKILFIDNGSADQLIDQDFYCSWEKNYDVRCLINDKNIGVYPTFQQGYDCSDTEFIFYSHNDVEMIEYGWDEKLCRLLDELNRDSDPGVCGMFGAKGLGTQDLYKKPYHFSQLMRWDCITVQHMQDAGARLIKSEKERIITLDGFSLIVSRKMVDSIGGEFDYESFPVHHNYDHDICLSSHFAGFTNWVLDIDCRHHGGVTSTREKWAQAMGTSDLNIHRKAHEILYEKYRGRLPVSVK